MWATVAALVLGHLLADFVLQIRHMVGYKHRPAVFAAHAVIVGLASLLALGAASSTVFVAVVALAGAHSAIDALKLALGSRVHALVPDTAALWLFCVDQLAHLATIGVFAVALPNAYMAGSWPVLFGPEAAGRLAAGMGLIAGVLVAVRVGDLLLALLLDAVRANKAATDGDADTTDTLRAGAWIGRLERGLVFLLVMAGQFNAIGFVIAAKSILRFEHAREPAQGEQVIVGTLASFGWAIATALATRALVQAI